MADLTLLAVFVPTFFFVSLTPGLCMTLALTMGMTIGVRKTMWRDASKHNSPNAGWPEAATAGALGLALAGPRKYPHHTTDAPWVGDGSAKATANDIERALYLYVVACLINALIVAVIAVFRFGVGA